MTFVQVLSAKYWFSLFCLLLKNRHFGTYTTLGVRVCVCFTFSLFVSITNLIIMDVIFTKACGCIEAWWHFLWPNCVMSSWLMVYFEKYFSGFHTKCDKSIRTAVNEFVFFSSYSSYLYIYTIKGRVWYFDCTYLQSFSAVCMHAFSKMHSKSSDPKLMWAMFQIVWIEFRFNFVFDSHSCRVFTAPVHLASFLLLSLQVTNWRKHFIDLVGVQNLIAFRWCDQLWIQFVKIHCKYKCSIYTQHLCGVPMWATCNCISHSLSTNVCSQWTDLEGLAIHVCRFNQIR